MKSVSKVFTEIGFDLDNNRFGFGRSVEIEYPDGSEIRQKCLVNTDKIQSHYLRLWLGKRVLVMDHRSPHFSLKKKNRWNFKLVLGKWGFVSNAIATRSFKTVASIDIRGGAEDDENSVSSHKNQKLRKG